MRDPQTDQKRVNGFWPENVAQYDEDAAIHHRNTWK